MLEDDVLVPEVLGWREADLRPLEPGEPDDIGLVAPFGDGVALPDRLAGHLPSARVERLGVVGQRVEVELGAEAGEVTRVRGRMHALASHEREAPHEGVDR